MTPDESQDPLGGTPDPAGPGEAPGTSTIDWEDDGNAYKKRYNDLRPVADRRATELHQIQSYVSDLRSDDPDKVRAAAQALGVPLADDEPEEYDDPYDEIRAELEGVKTQLSQREQNLEVERLEAEVERRMDKLGLPEDPPDMADDEWSERAWVLARAVQMPGPDGVPDIARAAKELTKLQDGLAKKVEQEWAKSKRTPRSIQPGQTATEQKNILDMTDEERVAYAVRRLQDMETPA